MYHQYQSLPIQVTSMVFALENSIPDASFPKSATVFMKMMTSISPNSPPGTHHIFDNKHGEETSIMLHNMS